MSNLSLLSYQKLIFPEFKKKKELNPRKEKNEFADKMKLKRIK